MSREFGEFHRPPPSKVTEEQAIDRAQAILDDTDMVVRKAAARFQEEKLLHRRNKKFGKIEASLPTPAVLERDAYHDVMTQLKGSKSTLKKFAKAEIEANSKRKDPEAVMETLRRLEVMERKARKAAVKAFAPTSELSSQKEELRSFVRGMESVPRWFPSYPTTAASGSRPDQKVAEQNVQKPQNIQVFKKQPKPLSDEVKKAIDFVRFKVASQWSTFQKAFMKMDQNKDGTVDSKEMIHILRLFNVPITENGEEEFLEHIGLEKGKDGISYKNFLKKFSYNPYENSRRGSEAQSQPQSARGTPKLNLGS